MGGNDPKDVRLRRHDRFPPKKHKAPQKRPRAFAPPSRSLVIGIHVPRVPRPLAIRAIFPAALDPNAHGPRDVILAGPHTIITLLRSGHDKQVGRQVPLPAGTTQDATIARSGHRDVPAHQKTNLTEQELSSITKE